MTYVCPMDPEVRESKPGACPKCGMALEPEVVQYTCPMHPQIVQGQAGNLSDLRHGAGAAHHCWRMPHEEDDSELRSMTRRFWTGVALSVPLLILSMGSMWEGGPLHSVPASILNWIQLVLATPVVLVGRLAVFSTWLEFHSQSLSQHVHADCAGDRHRLFLQPGGNHCAESSFRRHSRDMTRR